MRMRQKGPGADKMEAIPFLRFDRRIPKRPSHKKMSGPSGRAGGTGIFIAGRGLREGSALRAV